MLQEAFNNIGKHSGADLVRLVFRKAGNQVSLLIEDNGCGFDVAEIQASTKSAGMGLVSMKERATLSGGSLNVKSVPGKGTRIEALFPLEE